MPTQEQRLAEAHRTSQIRLAAALARLVGSTYRRTVTPATLQRPIVDSFIADVAPLILAYRDRSASLARTYYGRAVGAAGPDPDPLERDVVETSLIVTGWAQTLERLEAGQDPAEAIEKSLAGVVGSSLRHARNGGRTVIRNGVKRDTLGWYRVTGAKPCYFCAMLASAGARYDEDSFDRSDPRWEGPGGAKVHDNCSCDLAPLRSREQQPADFNLEMSALWEAVTRDDAGRIVLSGQDAVRAFRRAYETRGART